MSLTLSLILAAQMGNVKPTDTKTPRPVADQTVPARYRGKLVLNKPRGITEKVIALTFDDGPDPVNTPRLLNILDKYNAKATFFVIGSYATHHLGVVTETHRRGHVVANHTWSHKARPAQSAAKGEIDRTAALIKKATGRTPTLFRPPYGIRNNATTKVAMAQGYPIVLWNRISADTARNATVNNITYNVLSLASPGDIVLFHDGPGKKKTIDAVPRILADLQKKGYRFVTIPEMLAIWDAHESKGKAPTDKKQTAAPRPAAKKS